MTDLATAAPERQTRALVLGGGGARAAYEVGILSAIAERVPNLVFPIVTGVSAGAINATYLAAHPGSFAEAVHALRAEWLKLVADRVYRIRPMRVGPAMLRSLAAGALGRRTDPATLRGLVDLAPLREFLESIIAITGIDANIAAGRLQAVALSATSYSSGDVVTFVQGPPGVPTWRRAMRQAVPTALKLDHIMASAALPILFPSVRIDGAFYGDGSIRQTAPLSPAIHLGARGLLVITQQGDPLQHVTAAAPREYPTFAEVVGLLLHAVFLDALEADVEQLQRVNRLLAEWPAGQPSEGLRPINLLVLRPSRNLGALARGTAPRLPPLLHWTVRMLGGEKTAGADFLSYLVFDPLYTNALVDLGYADAQAGWERIERFIEATEP